MTPWMVGMIAGCTLLAISAACSFLLKNHRLGLKFSGSAVLVMLGNMWLIGKTWADLGLSL